VDKKNALLVPELDSAGGKTIGKDSVKNTIDIKLTFDLVDIWRIRNTVAEEIPSLTAFELLAN